MNENAIKKKEKQMVTSAERVAKGSSLSGKKMVKEGNVGVGKMPRLLKCLPCEHEHLRSDPQHPPINWVQ